MVFMDCLSKLNVGQLDECMIDQYINGGMNILIPLNMSILRRIKYDFDGSFSLKKQLYFLVIFGNDEFVTKPIIKVVEWKKNKIIKEIDFSFDNEAEVFVYEIALEGLMYILNDKVSWKPYHVMKWEVE